MKHTLLNIIFFLSLSILLFSCRKEEKIPEIVPSEGTTITFDGGSGGASAPKAACIDLSSNTTYYTIRSSWDLGFYCGSEFRVILNNTTSAAAKVTNATELINVSASDTMGITLAINQMAPVPEHYANIDDINGNINNTAIPAISENIADNKVVIINRGTGGGIAARPWIKAKITRNTNGGYTIQFGTINQTNNFKTVDIAKDANYHFKLLSFDGGNILSGVPKKNDWDFTWCYSVFDATFSGVTVPYNFSDLIAVNYLSGVKVSEKIYANATTRNNAFTAFNLDSIANAVFTSNRWAIGSNWRSTQPATGVRTDRFYVIKDSEANYYAVKFLSMGVNDGGVRGKPVFEYKLIK
ncbi:MAG: HmuY family protein [Chitinophagales bacterium]|nr:HmuY family protein [Chitinophagales bacterium]